MRFLAASILACALASALPLHADQVTLKNGDHLSGAVVKSDGKELVLKTGYAGEIKIQWSEIQNLTSDEKLYVATPDHGTVEGAVATQDADLVLTPAQGGEVRLPKASVTMIRSQSEQAAYEQSLHPPLTQGWAGGVNLGFALSRGNSKTRNLSVGFNAVHPTSKDKITLYANSIFASNDKEGITPHTTANAIFGGARYDRNISARLFAFANADFQYDEVQTLDLRSLFGGGVGFHVVKTDHTTLDLLGGANYTRDKYAGLPVRGYAAITAGEEFNHNFTASSAIFEKLYFYPDLDQRGEYRAAFDLGWKTQFSKWLGWQTSFSDRYVSNPPSSNLKNDILVTTGLSVSFTH